MYRVNFTKCIGLNSHNFSITQNGFTTLKNPVLQLFKLLLDFQAFGNKSWASKNWCFWNVVLEKTFESPLDCKEIQPVHPKGDQSWVFTGRTDADAETPTLWPPDVKSWLIGKDHAAGRDWGQEEKGMTEDEMPGWQHRLNGHGFGWTPGVGDGQGDLTCCSSWGRGESDTTEWLNWTELNWYVYYCFCFAILWMACYWNHKLCSFFRLSCFTWNMNLKFLYILSWSDSLLF